MPNAFPHPGRRFRNGEILKRVQDDDELVGVARAELGASTGASQGFSRMNGVPSGG